MLVKETNFIEFEFHIAESLQVTHLAIQHPFSLLFWQSSGWEYDNKNGIRESVCFSGGNVSEVMCMVNLGDVYAIRAIVIYFRIEESKIGKDNWKKKSSKSLMCRVNVLVNNTYFWKMECILLNRFPKY